MKTEMQCSDARIRPGQAPRAVKWAAGLSILVTIITAAGTIIFDFLSGNEMEEGLIVLALSTAYICFGIRLLYAGRLALWILPILIVVHFIFELMNMLAGDMISALLALLDCIVFVLVLLPATRTWCKSK